MFARAAAFGAVFALLASAPASACTCLEPPSVADSKAASIAVFTGFPLTIESAEPEYRDMVWVTFQVTAIWKGAVTPQYAVLTGAHDGNCGIHFEPGTEWLVYAFPWDADPDPEPFTHSCSRTSHAHDNPDLDVLGPPITTPAATRSWGRIKDFYR
jgi:hypothetical protein